MRLVDDMKACLPRHVTREDTSTVGQLLEAVAIPVDARLQRLEFFVLGNAIAIVALIVVLMLRG